MKQPHRVVLARREAAASIAWPEKTSFLVNPDPVIRKQLKKAAIIVGVVAVLYAIVGNAHGPLHNWIQSMQDTQERPSMEAAMKAGNRTAGTWLATHFWKDYPGLLRAEADAGEPNAMFLTGKIMMFDEHAAQLLKLDPTLTAQQMHAQGLERVRKAAAAGSEKALEFALAHGGV